jgi:hypothetical protein
LDEVGQIRGKSEHATLSRTRAPAGSTNAVGPRLMVVAFNGTPVSAPSPASPAVTWGWAGIRHQPAVMSVERSSGPTTDNRATTCASSPFGTVT